MGIEGVDAFANAALCSDCSLGGQRRQILVNQPDCHGAVSDGGGDPFRLAVPDVSYREDAGHACFKCERGPG